MTTANEWDKQPEDIAARIDLAELEGLRKTLRVAEGVTAALYQGAKVEPLPPGEHHLDGLLGRLNRFGGGRQGSVLLVDGATHPLEIPTITGKSLDRGLITVQVALTLQVKDPARFSADVMAGRSRISRDELARAIRPTVERAVRLTLPRHDTGHWCNLAASRDELATAIERALLADFERRGLAIGRVDLLEMVAPESEASHQRLREIQGREASAELELLAANVDLDRDEGMAGVAVRRAQLAAQARDIAHDDQIDEATKAQRLAEALAELEQAGALRAFEREQVQADLARQGAEAAARRTLALGLLDQRQREELENARRAVDHHLRITAIEQSRAEAQAQGEERLELLVQDLTLAKKQAEIDHFQAENRRTDACVEAEHEARIAAIQTDAQLDKQTKLQRFAHEEARFEWEMHERKRRQEAELERERLLRETEAAQARHAMELEATRLQQTDRQSDRDLQVRLAEIDASKSVEIAQVQHQGEMLQAQARQAADHQQQMNEAMQRHMEQLQQQSRETVQMMQQTTGMAMQALRPPLAGPADISLPPMQATPQAAAASQPPPAAAQSQTHGKFCPSCGQAIALEARFCPHCGAKQ